MVSACLPSDALLQHLLSYLGFSYLGRGVSLQGCSSKAQPLLLTLDEWYLLRAAPSDLERGVSPLMSQRVAMNSMIRQNNRILKEELPRMVSAHYATGDQWRNNSRKK